MPPTARRLSVWKTPKPTPAAAASSVPDTKLGGGLHSGAAVARILRRPARPAPQEELRHLGVGGHVRSRARAEHPAALHHDAVRGEAEPKADVLLDHEHRLAR